MSDNAVLLCGGSDHTAAVRVSAESREVARGDFDSNLVHLLEQVAGGPEIDVVFDVFAGQDTSTEKSLIAIESSIV